MIERIRKKYAMTEKGAKDYVAAVFWSVLVNISKMLPVGVLATALSGIVEALTNGTDPRAGLTRFLAAGVLAWRPGPPQRCGGDSGGKHIPQAVPHGVPVPAIIGRETEGFADAFMQRGPVRAVVQLQHDGILRKGRYGISVHKKAPLC